LLDSPHSGTATYIRNLVPHLARAAPDITLTLYMRDGQCKGYRVPSVRLRSPVDALPGPVGARTSKLLWEEAVLPAASAARGDALLHYLYFAAPIAAASPVIVTIHDLLRLVLPGYHRSRQASMYSRFMAWTASRAAAIVTVSEHSKRDIVRLLGVPPAKVHVTYEAAGDEFNPRAEPGEGERLRATYGLPDRFLLYLGGAERRKNIETLLRAWAQVQEDLPDTHLVIVAHLPPADALYPDLPRLARDLGLRGVRFVDAVAERDKPGLYRTAAAFAFPSTYEGFGLPPLEAMACGTPVISANATSLPEVVGEGGILVPANNIEAWAGALRDVLLSPELAADLGRRGIARAADFNWRRTAEETASVYRRVLGV
jgi:glycosyltransferase involved in cell wall biosynthesis